MTTDTTNAEKTQPPERTLPLRLTSKVVKGYGRGSNDLGIPTANLSREDIRSNLDKKGDSEKSSSSVDDLPTGIYWGFCRIGDDNDDDTTVYKTACSIGYNPYYKNKLKTVEPHLIVDAKDERRHKSSCGETVLEDFYGQSIRLSLVEYMRPELPFEGLEKLVQAIKQDICNAETLGDSNEPNVLEEKAWVASDAKA